jgi:hypothetical protein
MMRGFARVDVLNGGFEFWPKYEGRMTRPAETRRRLASVEATNMARNLREE